MLTMVASKQTLIFNEQICNSYPEKNGSQVQPVEKICSKFCISQPSEKVKITKSYCDKWVRDLWQSWNQDLIIKDYVI